VDGDTIVISYNGTDTKVRLLGINTPETVDPRKTVECFGKEASLYTKQLLQDRQVSIVFDQTQGEKDKYGRLLAYVYRDDGLFINKELVLGGYAYEYTYHTPYLFQKEFKDAQRDAEQGQKGLWNPSVCSR
jgi:micrococcal nuclease